VSAHIFTPCFPQLVEALRLLPGIGPLQERNRLGEAKYQASRSPSRTADFNGVQVTLVQLEELFVQDERGRPRVSAAGATLLLRLFKEGAFVSFSRRKVEGGLQLLEQYAQGLAPVIAFNPRGPAPRKARSRSENAVRAQKQNGQSLATTYARAAQLADAPLASFKSTIHRLV
jgi:hypothetical protein